MSGDSSPGLFFGQEQIPYDIHKRVNTGVIQAVPQFDVDFFLFHCNKNSSKS